MKRFFLFTLIAMFLFSGVAYGYSESAEEQIFSMLKQQGFDEIYVSTENDLLDIKLGFDVIPKDAFKLLLNTALESFEKFPAKEGVLIEVYTNDEPQFSIYLRGKDAEDYFKGKLTDEDISELVQFADTRENFSELADDLLEYNAFVESAYSENGTLNIVLRYAGNENDFGEDLAGILFCAVQDYPQENKISLIFSNNQPASVLTVKSEDVLKLFNEEITPDQFLERVSIKKQTKTSRIFSTFAKLFRGTGKSAKNVNGITGTVLFILSFAFFFAAKSKRKRIARIVKTKRIKLDPLPNKKHIYGKFNAIVECNEPLKAPFSQKETVIYKGKIQIYTETGDEEGNANWQTVWSKSIAVNFALKETKSGKSLLINKENLPNVNLPVIFKSKISGQDAEKVLGKRIRGKSIVAIEKGLENGRKVFFIGGIERNGDTLLFVRRPNYPNMISIHSEKRLTAHFKRVSGWLNFLGFILLLISAYFLLAYFGIL